jgi:hypothetical protein
MDFRGRTMDVSKITICGGGNGAQTVVPVAACNLGCAVDLYSPLPGEAERLQAGVAAHGGLEVVGAVRAQARPRQISASPAEVVPGSQVVLLVLPAFAHELILQQIVPFLDRDAWVGAMPARGGFEFCAARLLADQGRGDVGLFGLQTLPWACRIHEFGQVVHVLGAKCVVDVASRPTEGISKIGLLLQRMLGVPTESAASLLALTLANTGQIIHPGIMHGLFADWDGQAFAAQEIPLFYQGLSPEGADLLACLSDDVQAIRAVLEPALDLRAVRPLQDWIVRSYGQDIGDPSSLYSAFVTNRAYAGLKAPVREAGPGRYVPDFAARYLAEDVPFGLAVSRAIADLAGVQTPAIDHVIAWAGARLGKDYFGADFSEARTPQKYGWEKLDEILAFAAEA